MKLTFEVSDKDLDAIASAVAAKMAGAAPKAPKAAKPKAAAPEVEETEVGETETAETDAVADNFETDGEAEGATPTRDDVRVALVAVSKKHGQDKAMEVLKQHGKASALSKLVEDKFAAVIAAANKAAK